MITVVRPVIWKATDYPITVAEVNSVSRLLDNLLSAEEKDELIDCLAFNPEGGEISVESCGIRKIYFRSRFSRTRLRVMYYFHDLNMPLYIVAVYKQGEKIRITKAEEAEMNDLVEKLVAEYASKNMKHIQENDLA